MTKDVKRTSEGRDKGGRRGSRGAQIRGRKNYGRGNKKKREAGSDANAKIRDA